MSTSRMERKVDVLEHGLDRDGSSRTCDRRLFMQLQVFTDCLAFEKAVEPVKRSGLEAVVYADVNDPRGIGILTMTEDPVELVTRAHPVLNAEPFRAMRFRPELTMLGRTYSSGFEPDLEDWLLQKPRRNTRNPDWRWAVWYPLRRVGPFNALPDEEQKSILREHGGIGRLYGEEDLAHDIRLACHGLDAHDNEFVIGLVGRELHPLSHLVQRMRRTRQTSEFMEKMGPFFVGHAVWQRPLD
ncbi:MAG TPA: chlorite dismutase family protein [Vicinamibacteria bacterium]|nr:chlorite dismutase family protein [Vicinamibacteria bacterium]